MPGVYLSSTKATWGLGFLPQFGLQGRNWRIGFKRNSTRIVVCGRLSGRAHIMLSRVPCPKRRLPVHFLRNEICSWEAGLCDIRELGSLNNLKYDGPGFLI